MITYRITVIESDEPAAWMRFARSESWGSIEPYWRDGEQLGSNVVTITVDEALVARLERALDADDDVLRYSASGVDPDAQCRQHGCSRRDCDLDHTGKGDGNEQHVRATIHERGNGLPDVGDYCAGEGQLYRVDAIQGRVQTDSPRGNYVYADVTRVEWDACEESAEHTASVVVADDDQTDQTNDDDDDVRCESGEATGVRCEGRSVGRVIEYMPEYLRESHRAAGNSGCWPHNGSIRLSCCEACACMLLQDDDASEVV